MLYKKFPITVYFRRGSRRSQERGRGEPWQVREVTACDHSNWSSCCSCCWWWVWSSEWAWSRVSTVGVVFWRVWFREDRSAVTASDSVAGMWLGDNEKRELSLIRNLYR